MDCEQILKDLQMIRSVFTEGFKYNEHLLNRIYYLEKTSAPADLRAIIVSVDLLRSSLKHLLALTLMNFWIFRSLLA